MASDLLGWLGQAGKTYLVHPLKGNGYQFWSGIAGSFVVGGGIWAGVLHSVRRHNCHEHRCWRVGRHVVKGTPYCRKHRTPGDIDDGH